MAGGPKCYIWDPNMSQLGPFLTLELTFFILPNTVF